MGAESTLRSETGERLEVKEGIVLDRQGRRLTQATIFGEGKQTPENQPRFSLSGGNGLWVLMLAFFTPVLVIASFLAFGSLAAVLAVAWLGFAAIRGVARLFS
ncbi:MAG: hypothetical protein A2X94_00080 [Bdellovibrionales bacterium GWB1_55_8]|nr:MAG: hypothetical protein A2X94_00080 [Bdellovibrionales bacterium GWB1_55_8]